MPRRFQPAPPPVPPAAAASPVPFEREAARASIARLAAQAAAREGLEIAWVDAPLEGKNWTVRVFLDRPDAAGPDGAVSLGECSRVSEHLSVLLDLEDPVMHPYNLEVSSPGLDRPLFTPGDFRRFAGRLAVVITTERVLNQTFFRGHIESSDEQRVNLRIEGNKLAEIPFSIINKANLEVEF
jgi:ribosome maturation factor RimP